MKLLAAVIATALTTGGASFAAAKHMVTVGRGDTIVTRDYQLICSVARSNGDTAITCGRVQHARNGYITVVSRTGVSVVHNGRIVFIRLQP